ncbi:damage-inducible protein CinA [Brevundimonas sp. Leaf363]|uniref:CinA family protein n=1 Tax=Brevundimonas sp. Leaf363 TaxID=1736353 RepID=UPI0006F69D7C|nr:nicotinamide-nucleotide amidohydrolase family protein [Brevundimonas sp. Leaf363]KQS56619.1 damage-inducible protein CinA [Brevundimonas sp. Leaf363]
MLPEDVVEAATGVIRAAVARGMTLVTAESCTGGLVAGALTAVAGSSAAVEAGFVTYSNAAKTRLIGVDAAIIAAHGAVSEETARAMAQGARARGAGDLAVSITGIAGPGGGSADKPVGLVHFATAGPRGVRHREVRFGDLGRDGVRHAAVLTALEMLQEQLADD